MMYAYELHTGEPVRVNRRDEKGRFAKGHKPFNKGKNWDEYLSPEKQRKVKEIGVKNLRPLPKGVEAHNALPIISIDAENRMLRHKSITHAAKFFGICRENIGRCARQNSAMIPNKKTGKVNTNHRYMGIRFYLEDAVHLWSNARRSQE
jgi:hypothetical protein